MGKVVDEGAHPSSIVTLPARQNFLFVRNGLTQRRNLLVVQARRNPIRNLDVGAGFTATKKIGNAVARNRAKRRLRHAAAEMLTQLGVPGVDYVFIARLQTATCPWRRLLDDMESALISLARRMDQDSGRAGAPERPPNR